MNPQYQSDTFPAFRAHSRLVQALLSVYYCRRRSTPCLVDLRR
jgi:hypothetical protein